MAYYSLNSWGWGEKAFLKDSHKHCRKPTLQTRLQLVKSYLACSGPAITLKSTILSQWLWSMNLNCPVCVWHEAVVQQELMCTQSAPHAVFCVQTSWYLRIGHCSLQAQGMLEEAPVFATENCRIYEPLLWHRVTDHTWWLSWLCWIRVSVWQNGIYLVQFIRTIRTRA